MRPVRVVSFNFWNDRHDPERRLEVAIEGLHALQPDLVGLQEIIDATPTSENQAGRMARALGFEWRYDVVDPVRPEGALGNAVLSRYPIVSHASMLLPGPPEDARRALLCTVDAPAGHLPFVTCHLAWEMWQAPRREAQVVALDEFVRAHPAELPAIMTGDFNATPDATAIRFLTGRTGLQGRGAYYRDCFQRRHPDAHGFTWSTKNPNTVRWIERNRRIDYIFVGQMTERGWGAVLDARIILDIPGPDGTFASDHFGVYAEIGVAPPEQAV